MSVSIGIVGLPNVGKSTLFNALLKKQAALAANYPFATIEPNTGIVPVPDTRLNELAKLFLTNGQPAPIVPATVTFVDIAGLVAGAAKGEGLGNKFLSHIRETSLICHVLRVFEDGEIVRAGAVDPVSDYQTIATELQLADLTTLEKQKAPKGSTDKTEKFRWEVVQKLQTGLNSGLPASQILASEEEREVIKPLFLLTAKPELFIGNVGEDQLSNTTHLRAELAKKLGKPEDAVVIISAKLESELAALGEEDQKAYLSDLGLTESGFDRLIQAAYKRLGLQSFLTAGEKEVRAWTIPVGATAVEAAGVIHTDFMNKFIKANICSYADFMTCGSWKVAKEQGKMRQEGRDYIMREGDVVEFMIGA